ncbi:Glycerate dehydrogenase [Caulifigura coniformis]|uniref:Glycerate dehydrogenase n=2 Tax=Caulifigura coniformis TaxID=2527983 RepID=A0A517SGT6_9PLAN|nr:Glycerate dehydrogenase [Caulifigura coniformis]
MADERKVLITDAPWGDVAIESAILKPHGVSVIAAPNGRESTLAEQASDVDAIATCWAKVTSAVINAAARCRHIARMGIGLDNIDVASATARGMLVTNVPDYCVEEVADHAMALLLASVRNVGFFHHRIKTGEYDLKAGAPMHRLSGRTLGLIGFGKTARAVFQRAKGFGLRVIAASASGNDYGTGCRMVSLDELLAESDLISIHAPLTPETRHLVNRGTLARCRRGVFLVNTSRGGLIDQSALQEALESGQVAGAGLDVFDPEPPDVSQPLLRNERVIATPHAAFVSEESLVELRERVARQIADVLEGRTPPHVVNGLRVGDGP